MKKKSLSRQAKLKLETEIRHRINAGRVAIKGQIVFFRRHFGQVSSDWKADASRVTFADIAISENLFSSLNEDFAKDDFCSEEMSSDDSPMHLESEFAWVLDPIDGTKELIAGRKEWTVNIALIQNKKVTWAGLSAPLLNEIFIGDCLGREAFFMEGDKESTLLRTSTNLEILLQQKKLKVLCSISHPEAELDHWLKGYKGQVEKASVGSSLKFCRIAQNQADLYPRFVGLKPWDIAAGHGILKAAGGNLWNMQTLAEVSYGNPFAKAPLFWAF